MLSRKRTFAIHDLSKEKLLQKHNFTFWAWLYYKLLFFIGMNIVFWNCQGLRPKRKELQNYLLENQTDILALNETFLEADFLSSQKLLAAS